MTLEQFQARLSEVETFGGLANRLLFLLAHRTQVLPDGGNVPDDIASGYGTELRDRLGIARRAGHVHLTARPGPSGETSATPSPTTNLEASSAPSPPGTRPRRSA